MQPPPPASPSERDFRRDINGLRALSVVLVLLYHFRVPGFGGGYIGVDTFFVISGYLMTRIVAGQQAAGRFGYWRFLQARANRIFPALIGVLLALLALGAVALPPIDLLALAEQAMAASLFVANEWYRHGQGYFAAGDNEQWLLHTWSLGVEWQFYLLHPLLLMLAGRLAGERKGRGTRARRAQAVALLAAFGASLALCVASTPQFAFFSFATRGWELLAGGLVFACEGARSRLSPGQLLTVGRVGLLLLLASNVVAAQPDVTARWPGPYALLPVAGAALVIWSGTDRHRLLGNRIAQHLGRWSYSIYLWHWPLVVWADALGQQQRHPAAVALTGVAAATVLGALSFTFIESRRLPGACRMALTGRPVLASMAVIALTSWIWFATDGLLLRARQDAPLHRALIQAARSVATPVECVPPEPWSEGRRDCRLNADAGGLRTLVIGDSHAEHLYAWFADHVRGPTRFMVAYGCPLVPGLDRPSRPQSQCAQHTAAALQEARSGRYDTVVLSVNWTPLALDDSRPDLCRVTRDGCERLDPVRDAGRPVEGMRQVVRDLAATGIEVVVVAPTPFSPQRVPYELARQRFWHGQTALTIRRAPNDRQSQRIDEPLRELAGELPNVRWVDLRPSFCDSERCSMFDDALGIPVYKDTNHFNPTWIAMHGDVLQPSVGTLHSSGPDLAR